MEVDQDALEMIIVWLERSADEEKKTWLERSADEEKKTCKTSIPEILDHPILQKSV